METLLHNQSIPVWFSERWVCLKVGLPVNLLVNDHFPHKNCHNLGLNYTTFSPHFRTDPTCQVLVPSLNKTPIKFKSAQPRWLYLPVGRWWRSAHDLGSRRLSGQKLRDKADCWGHLIWWDIRTMYCILVYMHTILHLHHIYICIYITSTLHLHYIHITSTLHLHYIALHWIALHCITLHDITLHYTTSHYPSLYVICIWI